MLRRLARNDDPPQARAQVDALQRLARAVGRCGGADPVSELLRELAEVLGVALAWVAVFEDDARASLRTVAACGEGRVPGQVHRVASTCCEQVLAQGGFCEAVMTAQALRDAALPQGLSCYAGLPLLDGDGQPLGVLAVLDPRPIAGGDAAQAQALLSMVGSRVASELDRTRAHEVLQSAAQALSAACGSGTVFEELVRSLAAILKVDIALIARWDPADPATMHMLALCDGGQLQASTRYELAGSPCETVLAQSFRAYPQRVMQTFPEDQALGRRCVEGYAGYPLTALDGTPLGLVAVISRSPLCDRRRLEITLQIFAVRAAAELEQLRASEALRRSEASYRAIFEAAEDAIYVHDWDSGEILDANPKACETYGCTREELVQRSLKLIGIEEEPYTRRQARQRLEQAKFGHCAPFDWKRRNRDGSVHWDEVRLKPVCIGGHMHVVAFTRDVTQVRNAVAALQAREEQYRAIFDGSVDLMVLRNAQLQVVDVNEAFVRVTGLSREQVIGVCARARPDAQAMERLLPFIEGALGGREEQTIQRLPCANGELLDLELRYVPVRFGGEAYALGVGRDVSERLERERELRRSEARLRATVEAAFDCVIGMDGEGRIVEFNRAAERVLGHRRQDVLGRSLAQVLLPQRHREAHERGLKLFHEGRRGPMLGRLVETVAVRADGAEIPVELAISVATVPEGSIFVGHLRDISVRRRAEAERATLEAQLRQSQKMEAIGQLTGGIAHDFNNILTSVVGYLVLAEERAQALGDAKLVRQLGQAQLASQRARDLIAQMLAFARRRGGERRPLALAPLVQQTLSLLRATLPASLVLDGPTGQAPGERSLCVQADTVQLEQVLFNLCINARDAMAGAGHITVQLGRQAMTPMHCASCHAAIEGDDWVVLSVDDAGEGIEPQLLASIFDPFFSTKPPGQGSGMGLAMVHGIVHDHGGHIGLDTQVGHGTTFSVLLPPCTDDPVAGSAEKHPARPNGRLRATVLVVDDERMVGEFLEELLQGWGLDVVLYRDPLAASAWLEDSSHAVDLLITDQTMPQRSGLELARHARSWRPALPVVLVSGNAQSFEAEDLDMHGVDAMLTKPIDTARLREVLLDLLRQREAT